MSSLAREYQEKRDFIRMSVATPATLTLNDGTIHTLTCNDLSSSGAQLQSDKPVAINQSGKLVIASGGGSTEDLEVEVSICRLREETSGSFQIGVIIDKYL